MKEKIGRILSSKYIDFTFYLAYFAVAIYISVGRDFWYDEVSWTVRFVHKKSMLTMLKELSESLYNLPLHYLVMNLFYKISHDQTWLRLPSILTSLGAIYYTQKFIIKHYGNIYRLLAYVLFLFSPIMFHIALQIRPYAFMFLFSAMSYYFYYERLENDKWKNIITFGIILTLLSYSHWYGGLLVACYGVTDFYLWLKKKVRFKCIVSYIICFLLFLPWLVALIENHYYDFQTYWGGTKSYDYILRILYCITGSICITFFVVLAIAYALYSALVNKEQGNESFVINPLYHISVVVLGIWTAMWGYGCLVPEGSLIEIRYFFVYIPLIVILLISFVQTGFLRKAAVWVIDNAYKKNILKLILSVVAIVAVFYFISVKARPIEKQFFGYQRLLQDMRKDADANKRVLSLILYEFFWNYYDENIKDIDAVTYYTFRFKKHSEKFRLQKIDVNDKKQVMDFIRVNQNTLEVLEHSDCAAAMRYYAENETNRLHYIYKNSQKIYEVFPYEDLCKYDVIYMDTRFWLRFKYLKMFLSQYYEIIPYPKKEDVNHIEKLVRKEQ